MGLNSSGLSDPYVIVELMGKSFRTKHKTETINAFFDNTFYFNFKNLTKEQLASASLKLTVLDYNYFRFNELIGIFQVIIILVYHNTYFDDF